MKKLITIYKFLGKKVCVLFGVDILLGVFWFFIESGFLLIFQGFLLSIKVLPLESSKLPSWYPADLTSNLIILLVFGLVRAILIALKNYIPIIASNTFKLEQRLKIIRRTFFYSSNTSTSEILSTFGDLTNKAGQFIHNFAQFLVMLICVFCLFVLSLKIAYVETLVSTFLLVIFMLPLKLFNKRIREDGEGLVKEWDLANSILVNGINNLFLLKIYNVLGQEFKNAQKRLQQYEHHYVRYIGVSSIVSGFPVFLGILIIAVVTYFSRIFLQTDSLVFLGFLYLFLRIAQSSSTLSVSFSHALFYQSSFFKLLEFTREIEGGNSPKKTSHSRSNVQEIFIQFNKVSFYYEVKRKIISDMNFNVSDGKVLLIKGPSGSGKSTLIKLLFGMLDPTEGNILINGISAKEFLNNNYQSVGYVGPEPYLIPGTVRDNLLYGNGNPLVSDAEICASLEKVGLYSTIFNLKDGLNEYLFEDTQFSTGQKQRLSFARALLRNPKLLVLDEATANLDSDIEKSIIQNLVSEKSNITMVIISHRASFDSIADITISLS